MRDVLPVCYWNRQLLLLVVCSVSITVSLYILTACVRVWCFVHVALQLHLCLLWIYCGAYSTVRTVMVWQCDDVRLVCEQWFWLKVPLFSYCRAFCGFCTPFYLGVCVLLLSVQGRHSRDKKQNITRNKTKGNKTHPCSNNNKPYFFTTIQLVLCT